MRLYLRQSTTFVRSNNCVWISSSRVCILSILYPLYRSNGRDSIPVNAILVGDPSWTLLRTSYSVDKPVSTYYKNFSARLFLIISWELTVAEKLQLKTETGDCCISLFWTDQQIWRVLLESSSDNNTWVQLWMSICVILDDMIKTKQSVNYLNFLKHRSARSFRWSSTTIIMPDSNKLPLSTVPKSTDEIFEHQEHRALRKVQLQNLVFLFV